MRITLFFFFCFLLSYASAGYSQEAKLKIRLKSVTIKEVCKEIERESDYIFAFSDNVTDAINKIVDVSTQGEDIDNVLDYIFKNTELEYKIIGKQVVVYSNSETKEVLEKLATTEKLQQKEIIIKGKVRAERGESMPGVTIILKGTTRGVTTDISGNFTLTIQSDDIGKTLRISYVGFRTKEMKIVDDSFLDIVLEDDVSLMDELVVIGYGSKDRKSLTSSISSIKSDDVERLAAVIPSVDGLLGGTIKGVFSTQKSGAPGAGLEINVRGTTSPIPKLGAVTQGNVPLYVIDGMTYFVESTNLNPLLAISPNDIESIDVLKDAAATAIYGSRGANGVIIVKTKNGRKGDKVSIDAGYTFSMANPIREYKPLNIAEFKQLQDIIMKGTVHYITTDEGGYMDESQYNALNFIGNVRAEFDPIQFKYKLLGYDGLRESAFGNNFTNWVNEVTNRNAGAHQYYVSLRGGSEKTNYSASVNATNQEGVIINDKLNKYGIRTAIDAEITSNVRAGTTLSYTVSSRKSGVPQSGYRFGTTPWRMRPDVPVYDKNGDFSYYDESYVYGIPVLEANPVAIRSQKNKFDSQQFMGSGYIDIDLFKELRFHADLNVFSFAFRDCFFTPSYALMITNGVQPQATIQESTTTTTTGSVNIRLDYNKSWAKHDLMAMLGAGSDRSHTESRLMYAQDFFNETILNNIGSANIFYPIGDGYLRSGLNSVYSRLSYNYANRYLTELSFRADWSSKFGPRNRMATFPALSLGWRINNENFMKNIQWVDDLKLRLSLGQTGSTNVADFSYLQYYSKGQPHEGLPSVSLDRTLPNQDIKWEITTEQNFGIDFSFFDRRLYGSLDLYNRITKGALSEAPYVTESGMNSYSSNLIDMNNKGFEFEIGSNVVHTNSFDWTTSLNISSNQNKVLNLNGSNLASAMQDRIIEGYPVGMIKGYKVMGIAQNKKTIDDLNKKAKAKGNAAYQNSLGVGDYIMEDTNNDGKITSDDRVPIGSPLPLFFGGWNNVLKYKNFELSFLMQFSAGGKAINSEVREDLVTTIGSSTTRETFTRTWTPENSNALYPRVVSFRRSGLNSYNNDRFLFDTSYLRLKNVTISYNLSKSVLDYLKLQNGMLFVSVSNLFTITKWTGLDPELIGTGIYGGSSQYDPYPLSRTLTFGLNIQL